MDVGGIVGYSTSGSLSNNFEIIDCSNLGIITSTGYSTWTIYSLSKEGNWNTCAVGGIVGAGTKTKVTNCSNTNLITGARDVNVGCADIGGIAGALRNSEVTKCYNTGTIIGNEKHVNGLGGIVGTGLYNIKVNNCYNEGEVSGAGGAGGIVGYGNMIDIRYCYNKGNIKCAGNDVGGIAGWLQPITDGEYENLIYYCYNRGSVMGATEVGSINGYFLYLDTDYVYSLENTAQSNNNWGVGTYYINATNQGIFDKDTLTSTVLSEFGENFKQDYDGTESVNDGFPILSWQAEKSKMPKQENTTNK